jgi:hypothetical protein
MENEGKIIQASQSVEDAAELAENEPGPERKKKSEAAISGQVATYTLLFLFVFVGFLVWISG